MKIILLSVGYFKSLSSIWQNFCKVTETCAVLMVMMIHVACESWGSSSTTTSFSEPSQQQQIAPMVMDEKAQEAKPRVSQLTCQTVYSLGNLFLQQYPKNSEDEPQINKTFSKDVFFEFISSLDPHRIAFHQDHIEELADVYSKKIASYIEMGECTFIGEIVSFWKEQATQSYDILLKKAEGSLQVNPVRSFDFRTRGTLDISSSQPFSASDQELDDHLSAYLAAKIFAASNLFSISGENKELRSRLKKTFQIQRDHILAISPSKAYGIFLNAFLKALDKHSSYRERMDFDPSYLALTSQLGTIEAVIEEQKGEMVVTSIPSTANLTTGLKVGDVVMSIHTDRTRSTSLKNLTSQDFFSQLLGPVGSVIELTVLRKSQTTESSQMLKVSLNRVYSKDLNYNVHADTLVLNDLLEDENETTTQKTDTSAHNNVSLTSDYTVGLLHIPAFYATTSDQARRGHQDVVTNASKRLDEFAEKNIDFLIIDLRATSKGFIEKAEELAELFIPITSPFQIIGEHDALSAQPLKQSIGNVSQHIPLLVLVDALTAGPAEAFVQAIQVHRRGFVVGDKTTAGVSNVLLHSYLSNVLDPHYSYTPRLGGISLSTARFYGSDGSSIENQGVHANIHIPTPLAHFSLLLSGKNPYFLKEDNAVSPSKTLHLSFQEPTVIERLVNKSQKRLAKKSKDLETLHTFNQRWKQTLEQLLGLKQEDDDTSPNSPYDLVDKNLEEKFRSLRNYQKSILSGKQPKREDDYLLKEALHIAHDYMEISNQTKEQDTRGTNTPTTPTATEDLTTTEPTQTDEESSND
ncbi:MAG: S41 family peptidase [Proteobacteria bacterium]|nr:S41 family peptidase [Pseudomonadota bacterium]